MKKHPFRSLSVKLPLLFVASVILIMGVVVPLVYFRFHNRMIDEYTRMAHGVTQLMVNAFDGDRVDEYLEKSFELTDYVETVDYLYTLRENYPDVLYMYIYRYDEDGGHVIIDLDAEGVENGEGYEVGYVYKMDEPFASQLPNIMAGRETPGYAVRTEEDGYLYTYLRPIFRSDGSYACSAGVDFSMDELASKDMTFTLGLAAMLLVIAVAVLFVDILYVRRRVTRPINELSQCAGQFAYDTDADRKRNIELLDALNIHTGDEIENVYHTLQSVTRDGYTSTQDLICAQMDIQDRDDMITAMAADYRSIYYADLDRDECVCYRATTEMSDKMWEGKEFSFRDGFEEYAVHCVADADREGFRRFVDPENIRACLAREAMISHHYLAISGSGVERYEMLRIAGVRPVNQREDGAVHAIGAGFSDVDRETRTTMEQNRALAEALTRAEEASAAKTAFLSSMSHEIRTPMNAIIGLDNIALQDESLSRHTRDELEKIGSSARHLLNLINDILDMSRIESGRMVLKEEEFSFPEMLGQINTIINGQCEDKGLNYVCNRAEPLDDYFVGDALRIRQVIINILGNAVKFTDPPGTVTFSVAQEAHTADTRMLHFTIQDTGIGMDAAFIPRLFEAFAQEDATTTNRYGGSGLGMAITKNMVDLMGGSIQVESEKGRGATFTVDLPLRRAQHVEVPEAPEVPVPSVSLAGLHVLIAEDVKLNAEVLSDLLELEDITSEWAENGQRAVQMFARSPAGHFDAILMDMRMPVMDGLTATREIRRLGRPDAVAIPIIALTANAFEEDVKQCLQAGMDAHLSKPVEIEELKKLLGRILAAQ